MKKSDLKIFCLGDSLTQGDYGGVKGVCNIHEKNYPYFLQKDFGCTVINGGYCGIDTSTYRRYYEDGKIDIKGADIIIMLLGTNGSLQHGGVPETRKNDYATLIWLCQRDNPTAKIVLCTPPHATENPDKVNYGYESGVENCYPAVFELAEMFQLPVIDIFKDSGLGAANEDEMQPYDGLHFGEKGYEFLANFIARSLEKLFPDLCED